MSERCIWPLLNGPCPNDAWSAGLCREHSCHNAGVVLKRLQAERDRLTLDLENARAALDAADTLPRLPSLCARLPPEGRCQMSDPTCYHDESARARRLQNALAERLADWIEGCIEEDHPEACAGWLCICRTLAAYRASAGGES